MVLQGMAKVCDRIVVLIGSSTATRSSENPFSLAERQEMIQRALQEVDLIPTHDITLAHVPDMSDDAAWVKACLAAAGSVSMLWTGDEQVATLFETAGIEIKRIKEVPGISGEAIRDALRSGGEWKEKVPPAVGEYLGEIGAQERVRSLS